MDRQPHEMTPKDWASMFAELLTDVELDAFSVLMDERSDEFALELDVLNHRVNPVSYRAPTEDAIPTTTEDEQG